MEIYLPRVGLTISDNSFEGAIIFENSQIEEQHETVNLLNEEVWLFQQKHLRPW